MERHWALFLLAVGCYGLSLLEAMPSFVQGMSAGGAPQVGAKLRGHASGASEARDYAAWRVGCQTASSLLACSACALASRARGKSTVSRKATEQVAEAQVLNPYHAFMQALENAAAKKQESIAVTQDVMKVKNMFSDEKFRAEMVFVMNNYELNEIERTKAMLGKLGELRSTVFPAFVGYLAKKRRSSMLRDICSEYVVKMYKDESIVPVRAISAAQLTEEECEEIKAKMQAKLGVSAIKLTTVVDANLLAGFRLEWNFVDPQNMTDAVEGLDLSLEAYLRKAAIAEGVVL